MAKRVARGPPRSIKLKILCSPATEAPRNGGSTLTLLPGAEQPPDPHCGTGIPIGKIIRHQNRAIECGSQAL
jgi:hypothetical protein